VTAATTGQRKVRFTERNGRRVVECLGDHDGDHGRYICAVGPDTSWADLSSAVAEHRAEYGCAPEVTE
jgi:hypothetical protein